MSDGAGPSALRIGGAAVAAAGAAAAPTILLGPLAVIALPVAFIVAGVHVLLFALPAYLLLHRRMTVDWAQAIIAGFVIGAVPLAIWEWLVAGPYQETSVGSLTWVLIPGILGMLGGGVFRSILGPPMEQPAGVETAAVFE